MGHQEYLELSQAVVRLGSSERTIRRRIADGDLVGRKVGKKWYVQVPAAAALPAATPTPRPTPPDHIQTASSAHPSAWSEAADKSTSRESHARERRWGRGHGDYTPVSGDLLDETFAVGRLAAWRKVRAMRAALTSPQDGTDGAAAAAHLLEGYLGYGMQKIDSYRICRGILCRLVTRFEGAEDVAQLMAASEALGAVHALIVTLNRRDHKRKDSRSETQHAANH